MPYRRMAAGLSIPSELDEGHRLASVFLTPILDGTVEDTCIWDHARGVWSHGG